MGILDTPGYSRAEADAKFAQGNTSAQTRAATAGLLSKLTRGVENAVYAYFGDSTGNETLEHVYLEFVALAARFPAYDALYILDNTGDGYAAPVSVQSGTGGRVVNDGVTALGTTVTSASAAFVNGDIGRRIMGAGIPTGATITAVTSGTSITISAAATAASSGVTLTIGARTLTLYNFAVSGSSPGFVLGARWPTAVAALPEPDLIFISHSHNMGDPTFSNGYTYPSAFALFHRRAFPHLAKCRHRPYVTEPHLPCRA